jgi:hypothetical protein
MPLQHSIFLLATLLLTNCLASNGVSPNLGPSTPPGRGFVLSRPKLLPSEPAPWGHEWRRGDETVWIGLSRAPEYPTFDGLGPREEPARACGGLVAGVHKSFMLPPLDRAQATDVLFFTIGARSYQVGYARPVKNEPADDVLEFMNKFCGG